MYVVSSSIVVKLLFKNMGLRQKITTNILKASENKSQTQPTEIQNTNELIYKKLSGNIILFRKEFGHE